MPKKPRAADFPMRYVVERTSTDQKWSVVGPAHKKNDVAAAQAEFWRRYQADQGRHVMVAVFSYTDVMRQIMNYNGDRLAKTIQSERANLLNVIAPA